HVDGAIVYGGITEIGDRPFGSLTLALTGDDAAITRAVDDLRGFTTVQEYPELRTTTATGNGADR
ncbi:NIL domain-containing protein, partial [Georgenia sp.]